MTTGAIYLDYNASTPVDPAVLAVMRPLLDEAFGNPSSRHWAGRPAKNGLERARGQVASLLGADPDEVVFTSGGSEANNLRSRARSSHCASMATISSRRSPNIRRS